jgi:hypothetical protein
MDTATSMTPLPLDERQRPQRIRSIFCRFYPERWQEHQEALDYYREASEFFGDKSELVIRALATYADDLATGNARSYGRTSLGRAKRGEEKPLVVQLSWRAYIDKYVEHRRALELYEQAKLGDGQIKHLFAAALLNLRDRERSEQLIAA